MKLYIYRLLHLIRELFFFRIRWLIFTSLSRFKYGSVGSQTYIGNHIYIRHPENIYLGNLVRIMGNNRFETYNSRSKIIFQDNISVGPNFTACISSSLLVKSNTIISENVFITDIGYSTNKKSIGKEYIRSIIIEENCFIGKNVVILPGVHLKKGSIVGANSVLHGKNIRGVLIED